MITRRQFLRLLAAYGTTININRAARSSAEDLPKEISDGRKGLYVTSWIAQSSNPKTDAGKKREHILDLLTTTEFNTAVIDVLVDEPLFPASVKDFVNLLKQNHTWCVARMVVTQNNHFAKLYPKSVIVRKSTGSTWSCRGSKAADPASPDLWNYTVEMSKRAVDFGFDEVQYDYIRFPSDCRPSDTIFPVWDRQKDRREVMREFFEYLTDSVRGYSRQTLLSVDVFGEAVLKGYGEKAKEEVGQFYEDLVDYFDIISPMVYPSHYSPGSFGVAVPASNPDKVIFEGLEFFASFLKSHSVRAKVRPWIQYFSVCNYGMTYVDDGKAECRPGGYVNYNEEKIMAQRRALEKLGITGFLYWDPNNLYNRGAVRSRSS